MRREPTAGGAGKDTGRRTWDTIGLPARVPGTVTGKGWPRRIARVDAAVTAAVGKDVAPERRIRSRLSPDTLRGAEEGGTTPRVDEGVASGSDPRRATIQVAVRARTGTEDALEGKGVAVDTDGVRGKGPVPIVTASSVGTRHDRVPNGRTGTPKAEDVIMITEDTVSIRRAALIITETVAMNRHVARLV